MPTYFIESDGEINISDLPHNNLINKDLKPGFYTYKVIKSPKGTIIKLDIEDEFKLPEKVYGTAKERSRMVINSYNHAKGNLGVLLQGLGGTGKSLLAKLICNNACHELKVPVIMIKDLDALKELGYLMGVIKTKSIIFIDEYEKIANSGEGHDDQSFILTLMDGTVNTNFLFLLTINDIYSVNRHLLSRPGRVRYLFRYDGISRNEIYHLCKDNLVNLSEEALTRLTNIIETLGDKCTYDIVMTMIDEIKLYPADDFYNILMRLNTKHISDIQGLTDSYNPSLFIHQDLSLADWLNDGLNENVDKQETVTTDLVRVFRKPLNYLENISNSILPAFTVTSIVPGIHQLNQDIQEGIFTVSLRNVNGIMKGLNTSNIFSEDKNVKLGLSNTSLSVQKLASIKVNHLLTTLIKEIMLKSEEVKGTFSISRVSYKLTNDYNSIVKEILSPKLSKLIEDLPRCGNDIRQYFDILRSVLENKFISDLSVYSPYILFEYNDVKENTSLEREMDPKELLNGRKLVHNRSQITFDRRKDENEYPF